MADSPLVHASKAPESNDDPAPALVFVHGRGANERDLLPIAEQLPGQLHVLSVRAPDRLRGGYTWYELDLSEGGLHASQPHAEQFRRSLDLLHEFIEWAIEAYDIDPERVGLLGFSQGSIMSLAALCERPERYAWIVALHGYLAASHEDRVEEADGKPVFIGGGETDQVIPPERTERTARLFEQAGADVTFDIYPGGHGTHPDEVADVNDWLRARLPSA